MASRAPDWAAARADYEAGMSLREVARKHGVSHPAVRKRVLKEGWVQNLGEVIKRKTEQKVAGVDASQSRAEQDRAVDEEAQRRADVVRRHRQEWEQINAIEARAHLLVKASAAAPVAESAEEAQQQLGLIEEAAVLAGKLARLAKALAETTRIRQFAERKSYSLDDLPAGESDDEITMTDDELAIRLFAISGGKRPS